MGYQGGWLTVMERAAKKATPGPWVWRSWELGLQLQSSKPRTDKTDPEDWPILLPRGCGNNDGRGCRPEGVKDDPLKTCALMPSKEDRDHIAACSPERVRGLAKIVRAAAAYRASQREVFQANNIGSVLFRELDARLREREAALDAAIANLMEIE